MRGEKVEWKLMYDGEDGSQQPYTLTMTMSSGEKPKA